MLRPTEIKILLDKHFKRQNRFLKIEKRKMEILRKKGESKYRKISHFRQNQGKKASFKKMMKFDLQMISENVYHF